MKSRLYYLLGVIFLVGGIAWLYINTKSSQNISLQKVASPANEKSKLPRLRVMQNGDQLMSWVEPLNTGHVLKYAVLHEGNWVKKGTVAHGENWFVNWADFPSVVSIDDNFWVAHWLVKQSGGNTFDYDVVLAISNDSGNNWREIGHPHQDRGKAAEHGFVTIFSDNGEAGIVWLDGRDYVKKQINIKEIENSGNFNLRYTRIHRDGSMEAEKVIDNNTCTCCWTAVATTPQGPVAAWRGRTNDDIRDNRVALLRNGKWTTSQPLGGEGWHIDGCPVNGPSLASNGNNVVAAWYTAANDQPRVRIAFSKDGGLTFSMPIDMDNISPLGRIGLVWRNDKSAIISWMAAVDTAGKNSKLALRAINMDGGMSDIKYTLKLSAGRDTGVPQIAVVERGVLLAWTGIAPFNGINMMIVPWEEFSGENFINQLKNSVQELFIEKKIPFVASLCERKH